MLIGADTDCARGRVASQPSSVQARGSGDATAEAELRPQFRFHGDRVGLQRQQRTVGGLDLELVERTWRRRPA